MSSILLATVLMVILGLCGGITRIADFAGTAVVSGMMSGVGLMLAGVSWDMFKQEKRITLVSMVSALIAYALSINDANNVVWTIFVSVAVSTADFLFLQKRRVDLTTVVEQGRKPVEMSGEWRIWKREYWRDFKPIKPVLNLTVVLGALSIMMLNIGANISFGGITASLAGTSQNFDHLSIINLAGRRAQRAVRRPANRGDNLGHCGCAVAGGVRHSVHAADGHTDTGGSGRPAGPLSAGAEHIGLFAGDRIRADVCA